MVGEIEHEEGVVVEKVHSQLRWRVAVLVVGLLIAAFVPLVVFVVGVILLGMLAGRSLLPEMRTYVDPVLRIPIGNPRVRHTRLGVLIAAGLSLVALGAVSASVGGELRQAYDQREAQMSTLTERADLLIQQATEDIAANRVPAAEIALLNALEIPNLDPTKREEVTELLGRIQRSGNGNAIRVILARLSAADLQALETGTYLPEALDFGEPALTRRAVARAIDLLSEQRRSAAES